MTRRRSKSVPLEIVRSESTPVPEATAKAVQAETEASVIEAVQKAFNIPQDEALAVRRLRESLIKKLFTPERAQNSWTDLKATN